MTQPITTKDKDDLIKSIEKLSGYNQMSDLKEAVTLLKRKDTLFQTSDHRKIITFILSAIEKYQQIESDPNNADLINLCTKIIKKAPIAQPTATTPKPKSR